MATRYTDAECGQKKRGGWSQEGIDRHHELLASNMRARGIMDKKHKGKTNENVHQQRADERKAMCAAWENTLLQGLREANGVKVDSPEEQRTIDKKQKSRGKAGHQQSYRYVSSSDESEDYDEDSGEEEEDEDEDDDEEGEDDAEGGEAGDDDSSDGN